MGIKFNPFTGKFDLTNSDGITSHLDLSAIGTNTHAQIDTHISINTGTNTGDQTSVSGSSGNTDALNSATTIVDVSASSAPSNGDVLTATSDTTATWQTPSAASGDVVGGASSTDNAIARYDGTTGKLIQDYTSNPPVISDTGVASFNDNSWIRSERIGELSSVSGADAIAIGWTASASAQGISIGRSASGGVDNVAIGYLATCAGTKAVAIGRSSVSNGDNVAIGYGANCTGSIATSIGRNANASGASSIAMGYTANSSGAYSLVLGDRTTDNGFTATLVLGRSTEAYRANSVNFGSINGYFNYFTFGSGEEVWVGTAHDVTFTTSNRITQTDTAAGSMIIHGGAGTGTGKGGSTILKAFEVLTTGATTQTVLSPLLEVTPDQEVILNTEDVATADASLWDNSSSFYLDEAGDNFVVKTKWSDSTIHTLTIPFAGAAGDVNGGASSLDNEIVRFNSTSGKLIQAYTSDGPTISDSGVPSFATATNTTSQRIGLSSSVAGQGAVSLGYNCTSSLNGTSVGASITTAGTYSVNMGAGASTGTQSIAIGYVAGNASKDNSVCIGASAGNTSTGDKQVCIGWNAQATSSTGNIAIGYGVAISSSSSTVIGYSASATSFGSTVVGYSASCADRGVAIGTSSSSLSKSVAVGNLASAGASSTAVGYNADSSGSASTAIGYSSTASGASSFAMGFESVSSGASCFAMGTRAVADGDNSTVFGANSETNTFTGCFVVGVNSHARANNQAVLGSTTSPFLDFYLGSGSSVSSSTLANFPVFLQSSRPNSTQTNANGSDLTFCGSGSTGTGTGGFLALGVVPVGAVSGTTEITTRKILLKMNSAEEIVIDARDVATADASLWTNSTSTYLDEANNNIVIKSKDSGDVVRTTHLPMSSQSLRAIETVTTTATLDATQNTVLADATSGAFTITLPAVATSSNFQYNIKKIDSTANAITIDGNASELIDGSTTKIINTQWDCITLHCDGSAWYII